MSLTLLEGKDVDLIDPFPVSQVHRAVAWLHCYKTLVLTDDGPQTSAEMEEYLRGFFQAQNVRSFGIIDKNNKCGMKHEAPLVGFGAFEMANLRNGYLHCATTRRAWGSGLVDEAGRLIIEEIFRSIPTLTRVSSFVIRNNTPAKALAKRLGLSIEGVMDDAVVQHGEPQSVTHLGMTRRNWNSLCQSQQQSQPSSVELAA